MPDLFCFLPCGSLCLQWFLTSCHFQVFYFRFPLASNVLFPYSTFTHGGVAQLGERLTGSQEVRGSIPLVSTSDSLRIQLRLGPFLLSRLALCFHKDKACRHVDLLSMMPKNLLGCGPESFSFFSLHPLEASRIVTPARGRSSVGRALDWQSRGQGFDSPRLHLCN